MGGRYKFEQSWTDSLKKQNKTKNRATTTKQDKNKKPLKRNEK